MKVGGIKLAYLADGYQYDRITTPETEGHQKRYKEG